MIEFTPKSKRLGRLIAAAPEMYELLQEVAKYKPDFIWDVVVHAQELLARIDDEETTA